MLPTPLFLSNGGVCLAITDETHASGLLARLRVFLAPCFETLNDTLATPDIGIVLRDPDEFLPAWITRCVRPVQIRVSNAPGFSLKVAFAEDDPAYRLAWDAQVRVGYRIWPAQRTIEFFAGDDGFIHLIELVRYYGLHAEQARGTCVLHASAVTDPDTGAVTAIVGLKGAGKTTTLFSMVVGGSCQYFSGDKLLVDMHGDGVRARAWPDFPYIGAGTLRSYPELTRRLGLGHVLTDEAITARSKFLVDASDFRRAIPFSPHSQGMLEAVVLPQVDYAGHARAQRLGADDIIQALAVPGMFEWPHEFRIATWHGVVPRGTAAACEPPPELLRRLAALPWTRRDGVASKGAQ